VSSSYDFIPPPRPQLDQDDDTFIASLLETLQQIEAVANRSAPLVGALQAGQKAILQDPAEPPCDSANKGGNNAQLPLLGSEPRLLPAQLDHSVLSLETPQSLAVSHSPVLAGDALSVAPYSQPIVGLKTTFPPQIVIPELRANR